MNVTWVFLIALATCIIFLIMWYYSELNIHNVQWFRILSAPAILAVPLPLWMRLCILYLYDTLDCGVLKVLGIIADSSCKTAEYQIGDKIADAAVYASVLVTAPGWGIASSHIVLLAMMLTWRVIGLLKFDPIDSTLLRKAPSTNGNILVMYPDLFREYSLFASGIVAKLIPDTFSISAMVLAIIALGKILIEKYMHGGKQYSHRQVNRQVF